MNNNEDTNAWKAPALEGLPKNDPFVVAPGFFDRFPHEVQAMAVQRSRRPALLLWRAAAIGLASGCIIGVCAWLLRPSGSDDPAYVADVMVTPLTNEELDAMDDSDLLSIAEEVEPAAAIQDLGQVRMDLNEGELIAFLEHENTDINELLDYQ